MSAFMHDPQHFAAIVGTVYGPHQARIYLRSDTEYAHGTMRRRPEEWADLTDYEIAARILAAENVRSVAFRYPDAPAMLPPPDGSDAPTDRAIDAWRTAPLSVVEALQALDSYEYQSCECPDWQETAAWRLCQRMRDHLIRRLPGYDTAGTWSIHEPPSPGRQLIAAGM